jgi:hypothetical protein
MSQSQVPQASALTLPSYDLAITVLDFRESDHTANISILFQHTTEMKDEKPGLFGMDMENRWNRWVADSVHQEKNGTLLDERIGSWRFDFSFRAHAFGATEFYPYDSWMFNLTLTTPLLSDANSTNLHVVATSWGVPGWTLRLISSAGADVFRVVKNPSLNWKSVVVTFVLERAYWQTVSVRFVPVILMMILGVSVLIPPADLSSKATVYTSIIFFIGAFLFTLANNLSPYRSGLLFGETVFYNLFFLASAYLTYAVLENILVSKQGVLYLGKGEKSKRITDALRIAMYLVLLGLVWTIPLSILMSYNEMASRYSWVNLPVFETWLLPGVLMSWAIVVNLVALARGVKTSKLDK